MSGPKETWKTVIFQTDSTCKQYEFTEVLAKFLNECEVQRGSVIPIEKVESHGFVYWRVLVFTALDVNFKRVFF